MKHPSRFELRDCRRGFIQATYARIEVAIECAADFRREEGRPAFITDTWLSVDDSDCRIVWRDGEVTDEARAWVRRYLVAAPEVAS